MTWRSGLDRRTFWNQLRKVMELRFVVTRSWCNLVKSPHRVWKVRQDSTQEWLWPVKVLKRVGWFCDGVLLKCEIKSGRHSSLSVLRIEWAPPLPREKWYRYRQDHPWAGWTLADQYSWHKPGTKICFSLFFSCVGGGGVRLGVGPWAGRELGGWGRGELKSAFLSSQTISEEESLVEIKIFGH